MSKEKPVNGPGNDGYKVVSQHSISNVEGRLLTLVEALGLRDSQEGSAKSLISQTLWDWFTDPNWHVNIPEEQAVKIFQERGKVA